LSFPSDLLTSAVTTDSRLGVLFLASTRYWIKFVHAYSRYFVILIYFITCLFLTGCFGPDHPDYSRYEYLYIDGVFQGSYKSFPVGREREDWKCFDRKLQKEFSCTMVRGGESISIHIPRSPLAVCRMSPMGHSRRFGHVRETSALPPDRCSFAATHERSKSAGSDVQGVVS